MNLAIQVTQSELSELLLNVAVVRPVFIWGAPEDIIGIPQIKGETSEFLPPKMIARKEPYVLFLDELNACSQEVQKAFYSLIHERRIGEYHLPEGSIVIGAGNRAQDSAIVKTMSSALINRMFHVQLKVDTGQWIQWAYESGIHPWVVEYITQRPDHLFSEPQERDVLYFLAQSFRAYLIHELPKKKQDMDSRKQYLAHRAKALLKELAAINYEIAQMVVSADGEELLPDWFMVEIVRDLPRLVKAG